MTTHGEDPGDRRSEVSHCEIVQHVALDRHPTTFKDLVEDVEEDAFDDEAYRRA